MVDSADTPPADATPPRGPATWSRPAFEVADVFRRYGEAYRQAHDARLSPAQRRVLRELAVCRTAALGGHVNQCGHCDHRKQAYNSCRNRLCGKCRGGDRVDWYQQQARDMLPVEYRHAVFTVPDELARLTRRNPRLLYNLLFHAASRALLETGRELLGVELGLVVVLHSWGQLLNHHPHLHVLLPAGGIALADGRWIALPPGDALPIDQLMERFRQIVLKRLRRLHRAGRLTLDGDLAELRDPERFAQWHDRLAARRWMVYVDKATAHGDPRDPDHGERIVRYMARYVSGMVFSNHRLISIDDGHVTFFYKDYRDGERRKVKRMPALEFIDRLLDHVLPRGMRHKRYYGFMAPKDRQKRLEEIRAMLGCPEPEAEALADDPDLEQQAPDGDDGVDDDDTAPGYPCPACGEGRMQRGPSVPRPTVAEILAMPFPNERVIEQYARRMTFELDGPGPIAPTPVTASPAPTPSRESRQRLLPLVFT